jgi:ribosomal protein S18 acetylase RimI-like enzyme
VADPCLTPYPSALAGRFLIKSVHEHGSLGIEGDSVVDVTSTDELDAAIRVRAPHMGGEAFAEQYVHGREFNVALLADEHGPRCLPIPEILFEYAADDDTPRIVGYRAKWAEGSAEFVGTPRQFEFGDHDAPLLRELERQALATWHAFGCDGYVRVDFRVDAQGRVYVIDVNTNPCLSPDAGYAAALARAGIPYDVAIERIVFAAFARRGVRPPTTVAKEVAKRAPLAHTLRTTVRPSDAARVRAMCASTGFFNDEELDIAVELVDEHLARGEAASGYSFVFLDAAGGETLCYASYGRIAGTERAYDLFWIVTDDAQRGRGLGRIVLDEVERRIAALGGGQIHVETSSRAQYDPTRAFYERCGYFEAARFPDFYKAGDGKVVYVKTV